MSVEKQNNDNSDKNGKWEEYRLWIIDSIRRYGTDIEDIKKTYVTKDDISKISSGISSTNKDLSTFKEFVTGQLSALQIKSGVWGLIAGFLAVLIGVILKYFKIG